MDFVWDDKYRVFRREDYVPIAYSDGIEVEQRLFDIVRNAKDRSSFSTELDASISDWPSEYHLSRLRHCLLRPVSIKPGDRVLELGCGCGAITRYLGEIGAEVVAVEGSLLRSGIASERCRDLPNVEIYAHNLLTFQIARQFDWVLLIGVLEYAPAFSYEPDPVLHYVKSVGRFLSPRGRLLVAIENRLGLKYFNGCGEDHIGIPFFGVQDLYRSRTAYTLGRHELVEKLVAAGLSHTYFRYPFPDYKLPSVVLSPGALSDPDFDPVDLLSRCHARDYSGSPYRSFDEGLVITSLHKNGLLAELSNSFMVEAAAEPVLERDESELAVAFSVMRCPEFTTQTRFVRCGTGIRVFKDRLGKPDAPLDSISRILCGNMVLSHSLPRAEYRRGRQVLWSLLEARARQGDLETVVEALCPWVKFLLRRADVRGSALLPDVNSARLSAYDLPGDFVDCTPFNLLRCGSELVAIDMEWQNVCEIPLGWVITRGVLWSLVVGVAADNQVQSVSDVVEALSNRHGLSVTRVEVMNWLELETEFQTQVRGKRCESLTHAVPSSGMRPFITEISTLTRGMAEKVEQICTLTHSLAEAQQFTSRLRADYEHQLADLTANVREVTSQRDRMEGELSAVKSALHDVTSEHHRLRGEVAVANRQLDAANRELAAARLELSHQLHKLDAVLRSRSWRLASGFQSLARFHPVRLCTHKRRIQKDIELLSASTLFDAEWYLATNDDVAKAGINPILHYLEHGANEGRDSRERFSTSFYLEQHPDVREADMNPLVHYLRHGVAEGRPISSASGRTSAIPAMVQSKETQSIPAETVNDKTVSPDVFGYMSAPTDLSLLPSRIAIG